MFVLLLLMSILFTLILFCLRLLVKVNQHSWTLIVVQFRLICGSWVFNIELFEWIFFRSTFVLVGLFLNLRLWLLLLRLSWWSLNRCCRFWRAKHSWEQSKSTSSFSGFTLWLHLLLFFLSHLLCCLLFIFFRIINGCKRFLFNFLFWSALLLFGCLPVGRNLNLICLCRSSGHRCTSSSHEAECRHGRWLLLLSLFRCWLLFGLRLFDSLWLHLLSHSLE